MAGIMQNLPVYVLFHCGICMEKSGEVAGAWGNVSFLYVCDSVNFESR